jgi:hypothetical protein
VLEVVGGPASFSDEQRVGRGVGQGGVGRRRVFGGEPVTEWTIGLEHIDVGALGVAAPLGVTALQLRRGGVGGGRGLQDTVGGGGALQDAAREAREQSQLGALAWQARISAISGRSNRSRPSSLPTIAGSRMASRRLALLRNRLYTVSTATSAWAAIASMVVKA